MALFQRLFGRSVNSNPPPQVQIVQRDVLRVTIDEWKSSEELVKQAKAILANPVFRNMLDVLRIQSPFANGILSVASNDERVAHALRGEGYRLALNDLESLGKFEKKPEEIESTFEPEEPNEI